MDLLAPSRLGADGAADFAPGVARLPIGFVNAYFVGRSGEPWVLVDTGLPKAAPLVRRAADARYGPGARPEAIVLTHGHFDHAGNVRALADLWSVPIYAHELELPFLDGRSDYPPKDPTMGGAIAFLARFFPTSGYDLGGRVQPLPADGTVPGLGGWRWLHTPGHTPGHVSLFREADRTLLAGDAVATMDLDSWTTQLTHERELARPPAPFTPDWDAANASMRRLAELRPMVLAAGHGRPMEGLGVPAALDAFAAGRHRPEDARYSEEPARFSEDGTETVPPPVPDPLPKWIAGAAATLGAAYVLGRKLR